MKVTLFILSLIAAIPAIAQDNPEPKDSVANIVDVRATYIGGYATLKEFIHQTIHYPENAPEGTVYVEFLVRADGSVGETRIQRGMDNCDACNEEALRVISSMPDWKPAIYAGKNVASYNYLPVRFEPK